MKSDLLEILRLARHSPSSHNTQPWTVRLAGDTLTLGYAPERQLKVGDPDKRELYISLGCFVETISLAASELGYKTTYSLVGDKPSAVCKLVISKVSDRRESWFKLISRRRSDRRLYQTKRLPPEDTAELEALTAGTASLKLFDEPDAIAFLSTQTHDATYDIMSKPDFRAELASWVRNNWTKKPDGMPAYTQGMPGPVSLIAKFVIKKNKGVARDQAKKDAKRILHSSAIGLIYVKQQTVADWINAGRLYQRACLTALKHDIKTAATSAAVVDDKTNQKIIKQFSLPGQPVALIRFGYTKNNPKASPRLDLDDFLTIN